MASSAVKQLRENRQKKYEEEQLVCPTETAKLMVKTHKGEAVIEVDYEAPIDNPENNELETKVPDVEENQEDDPFNPETYSYEEEGYNNQEGID